MLRRLVAIALFAALSTPAHSQLFKCTGPSGKTIYSDRPCEYGAQEMDQSRLNANVLPTDRRHQAQPQATSKDARREECFEILEGKLKPTQRRAIGSVCGADISEAEFKSCMVKLLQPQTPSGYEAIANTCTGQALPRAPQIQSKPMRCKPNYAGGMNCY